MQFFHCIFYVYLYSLNDANETHFLPPFERQPIYSPKKGAEQKSSDIANARGLALLSAVVRICF